MAKIARAQITPPGQQSLLETAEQTLLRVLRPGASVERYARTWRIGQINPVATYVLDGRIGFEGERRTFMWDEEAQDFIPGPSPNGLVVPFVINLLNLTAVFQIRPPDIRATSFTGAVEGMLRAATGEPWRVEPITRQVSFDSWRATVSKVTRMHFHVEPPNPNWEGRPQLEDLMRRLGNLDAADFDFVAENGVATDDELIVELADHVQRHYGRMSATGRREVGVAAGQVVESVLDSEAGEIEELEREADVPPNDPELRILMREIERAGTAEAPYVEQVIGQAIEDDSGGELEAGV